MRLLRGGLLAVCGVLLGISGHLLGGGGLPSTAPATVAVALIGAAAVAWAGRRRTFRQLVVASVLAQGAFHTVLSLGPGHGPIHGLDARMLVAHAVATLVTAAVLAYGERALAALGRTLYRRTVIQGPLAVGAPTRLPGGRFAIPPDTTLRVVLPRRGPPVAVAA